MNEREAMTDLAAIRSECVEVIREYGRFAEARNTQEFWEGCLAALEAAVHTAECPTCGTSYSPGRIETALGMVDCPAGCTDGRVVLGGLLMALVGERLRVAPTGYSEWLYDETGKRVDVERVPVFRARSMEEKGARDG